VSFYDDASLVLIPSGTKTSKVYSQKPTDGTGDLTFTRASIATRTNSAGLIEKVRTNLLTYSNTFSNAAWGQTNVNAPTANAIANPLTGAVDAWKLVENATNDFHYIVQTPTFAAGEVSFSFYAKAAERTSCSAFLSQSGNFGASFNLSTGVATASGTGNAASMVSVGNGWYRCIVTNNGSALVSNQVRIGIADGALSSYSGDGTSGVYIYAAQAEQGVATDYIPTTTAAVSVGPTNNVPRLDYSGGATCPRLLLEGQRSNLVFRSEEFENGYWTTSALNVSVSSNVVTAPDGANTADLIVANAITSNVIYVRNSLTLPSTGTYTFSVYAKKQNQNTIGLRSISSGTLINYDLDAETSTGGFIQNVGGGWFRIGFSYTAASTSESIYIYPLGTGTRTGNGVDGVYVWGAQLEAGAFVSTYIPTTTAAVTRLADACSKTGISSLIGQTEGTLFVDTIINGNVNPILMQIINNTSSFTESIYVEYFRASNVIRANFYNAGVLQATFDAPAVIGTRYKIAAVYKTNDFALYVNGVQIGTDNSGTVQSGLQDLFIGGLKGSPSAQDFNGNTLNKALLFKTRLTNAELASLTSL
jgi:hypothetical protein